MTHAAVDPRAEGRAPECSTWVARSRHRHGGGGHGAVARFWALPAPGLSLPWRGRDDWPRRAGGRTCGTGHAQDSWGYRPRASGLFRRQRHHDGRDRGAGALLLFGGPIQAWLSGRRREPDTRFGWTIRS